MENKKLILSTDKKLKAEFYIWFFVLILFCFFCFTTNFAIPRLNKELTIALQQLLVLSMLGGIPGILVWSRNKMKTLAGVSELGRRLNLYKKYVRIRQAVFFLSGFFASLMFVFTRMDNAFLLLMVVVCFCLFIVPTKSRLESEAQLTDMQEEADEVADPEIDREE